MWGVEWAWGLTLPWDCPPAMESQGSPILPRAVSNHVTAMVASCYQVKIAKLQNFKVRKHLEDYLANSLIVYMGDSVKLTCIWLVPKNWFYVILNESTEPYLLVGGIKLNGLNEVSFGHINGPFRRYLDSHLVKTFLWVVSQLQEEKDSLGRFLSFFWMLGRCFFAGTTWDMTILSERGTQDTPVWLLPYLTFYFSQFSGWKRGGFSFISPIWCFCLLDSNYAFMTDKGLPFSNIVKIQKQSL